MPQPNSLTSHKLHDVDTKYGLIQVCEGLAFLHSDVKLLHRNICPESIMINLGGAWKIFGFDYCLINQNPHDAKPYWPFIEFNPTWQSLAQPSLEYMVRKTNIFSKHIEYKLIFLGT